jgi:subtilisin family serine protease
VVSTVPAGSFGAADGTSVAAAHVAALSALVLAHHPDFRDGFRVRGAARVDRLLQIIRASRRPLPLGDPRWAAGMPDAVTAVGLAPGNGLGARGVDPGAGLGPSTGYAFGVPESSSPGRVGVAPADVESTLALLRSAMRAAGLATPARTGTPTE